MRKVFCCDLKSIIITRKIMFDRSQISRTCYEEFGNFSRCQCRVIRYMHSILIQCDENNLIDIITL